MIFVEWSKKFDRTTRVVKQFQGDQIGRIYWVIVWSVIENYIIFWDGDFKNILAQNTGKK
jgi:hypothetical protein